MSKSYSVDFKHADMKKALDLLSERILDVQRRRDHYNKMSGNQKVQIPDRFGNQIFDAKEMAWLYEHEHKTLQAVYSDIYPMFKMEVPSRGKSAAASSGPQPPAYPRAVGDGPDETG